MSSKPNPWEGYVNTGPHPGSTPPPEGWTFPATIEESVLVDGTEWTLCEPDGGDCIARMEHDYGEAYAKELVRRWNAHGAQLAALEEVAAVFKMHGAGFLSGKVEKAVHRAILKARGRA